jgi:hypothetical protein
MTMQAQKASHADVTGQPIPTLPRRRTGQSKRNIHGNRALFTNGHNQRLTYRGTTRSRDTKAMPGHPLAGLWPTGLRGMLRSYRPEVRAYAAAKLGGYPGPVWIDELAEVEL